MNWNEQVNELALKFVDSNREFLENYDADQSELYEAMVAAALDDLADVIPRAVRGEFDRRVAELLQ